MVVNNLPYKEEVLEENENFILVKREFDSHLDSKDLVWHRDKEDREIKVISGVGWYLQIENELPVLFQQNISYKINKEIWHRIINKKSTNLILEIKKHKKKK